ncbi:LPS-assembly protein LptD [Myxococcota bacterium]|nr:LPS-assembly protein LptD [Myxococcota bacterium]
MVLDTGADGIPNGHERGSSGSYEVDGSGDDSPRGFEGNGRFDEGEPLLDKGSRLVLNPRLAYPLRIADKIEILPEIGYHGTFYQTEEQGSEIRQLLTAQLDVRTRLRGSFNIPILNKEVLHVLEPRIAYTAISSDSQSDNPLLVPQGSVLQDRIRQLELSNITRDPSDRIDSLNAITIGVSNRFYGKADSWFGEERKADGDNFYVAERLVGGLSLGTQYNFSND